MRLLLLPESGLLDVSSAFHCAGEKEMRKFARTNAIEVIDHSIKLNLWFMD
jgi:hypothetical protein